MDVISPRTKCWSDCFLLRVSPMPLFSVSGAVIISGISWLVGESPWLQLHTVLSLCVYLYLTFSFCKTKQVTWMKALANGLCFNKVHLQGVCTQIKWNSWLLNLHRWILEENNLTYNCLWRNNAHEKPRTLDSRSVFCSIRASLFLWSELDGEFKLWNWVFWLCQKLYHECWNHSIYIH